MELSSTEVQRLIGIDCYRTLDGWVRTGLLSVAVPARGIGSDRVWSFLDLLCARVVADLRKMGVNTEDVRRAVVIVREMWHDGRGMGQEHLLMTATTCQWILGTNALAQAIMDTLTTEPLIVLNVGAIATELRLRLWAKSSNGQEES